MNNYKVKYQLDMSQNSFRDILGCVMFNFMTITECCGLKKVSRAFRDIFTSEAVEKALLGREVTSEKQVFTKISFASALLNYSKSETIKKLAIAFLRQIDSGKVLAVNGNFNRFANVWSMLPMDIKTKLINGRFWLISESKYSIHQDVESFKQIAKFGSATVNRSIAKHVCSFLGKHQILLLLWAAQNTRLNPYHALREILKAILAVNYSEAKNDLRNDIREFFQSLLIEPVCSLNMQVQEIAKELLLAQNLESLAFKQKLRPRVQHSSTETVSKRRKLP